MGRVLVLLCCALSAAGCRRPVPSGPFERAAFEGDTVAFIALIDQRPPTPEETTAALVWASRQGRVEILRLLLDRGGDPNRAGGHAGWTPLMHAIHTRQLAAARLLLDRGADPRIGPSGNSALEMAALDDEVELVSRIIAAGAPRAQQVRALDVAVRGGALVDIDRGLLGACRTRTVRALLTHDPTLRATIERGLLSSLWWARREGCAETVALVAGSQPE